MATNKAVLRISCEAIFEPCREFPGLYRDGVGLPRHVLSEADDFLHYLVGRRSIPEWFVLRCAGLRGVLEPSPRLDALMANLRAIRSVQSNAASPP